MTASVAASIAGTALALLEPGTYYSKPFEFVSRLITGAPDQSTTLLYFTKFYNPVILASLFLVALIWLYKTLSEEKRKDAVVAGVLFGLNVYTGYWLYLFGGQNTAKPVLRFHRSNSGANSPWNSEVT